MYATGDVNIGTWPGTKRRASHRAAAIDRMRAHLRHPGFSTQWCIQSNTIFDRNVPNPCKVTTQVIIIKQVRTKTIGEQI